MMKLRNRMIAVLIAAVVAVSLIAISVSAASVKEGSCGPKAKWTLDDEGTLTVSGEGAIEDDYEGWENLDLKKVVIESGITTVGDNAFASHNELESVSLSDTVQSIGRYAFSKTGIKELFMPNSVTELGDGAFAHCLELYSIALSDNITYLGYFVLADCPKMEVFNAPMNLEELEDRCLAGSNLDSIYFSTALKTIGENIFGSIGDSGKETVIPTIYYDGSENDWQKIVINDDKFKTAKIHFYYGSQDTYEIDGVTYQLDGNLLLDYPGDRTSETYTYPDVVESSYELSNNYLKVINLNHQVELYNLADYVGSCPNLESVNVPADHPLYSSVDGVLFNKDQTELIGYPRAKAGKEYTIPSTVKKVGKNAFWGVTKLEKVIIPDSVEHVDSCAFAGTVDVDKDALTTEKDSLKEVVFPSHDVRIGDEMGYQGCFIAYGGKGSGPYGRNFTTTDIYVYAEKAYSELENTLIEAKGLKTIHVPYNATGYEEGKWKNYNVVYDLNKKDSPSIPDDTSKELNGLVQGSDKKWAMYKDGKVDTSATGVYQNKNGWWRVENGYVNFDAQGIYPNKYGWWKTTNGKVTFDETGVFQNQYGWWRVENSKVNFDAQSIYQNKSGWWKTTNGKVTFKEDGVYQNQHGWWKTKDSKVDFNFTGIASNKNGSWYINKGKVDFSKNGKVNYNGKTYTVKNGKVQ